MFNLKSFLLIFLLSGCIADHKPLSQKKTEHVINADDITEELRKDFWSVIQVSYLDKHKNEISDLQKNDTFFIKLLYISDKFKLLNSDYKLYIYPVNNTFKIIDNQSIDNLFRVKTTEYDTINYSIFLESDNFLFKKDGGLIKEVYLGGVIQTIP